MNASADRSPQPAEPTQEPTAATDTGGSGADDRTDLERVVDELEDKVVAETGDTRAKIAEDSSDDGTDRSGHDAEPPV